MLSKKCQSNDPLNCRYHGIKHFASLEKSSNEVLDAIEKRRLFVLNSIQRYETLRQTYDINSFLKPEDYQIYLSKINRGKMDKTSDAFYAAESLYQYNWAKDNMADFSKIKIAIARMTTKEIYNIRLRDKILPSTQKELEEHIFVTGMLEKAFNEIPERKLNNRLFRGVSFNSEQEFQKWATSVLVNLPNKKTVIQLNEYTRMSANSDIAYSFATDSKFPVMIELLSKSGLYLNNFSPITSHEKEILIKRNQMFSLENHFTINIFDSHHGNNRDIKVLQFRDI